MEKKIDFTIKHREDVIDTLRLRSKEKKVLLGLIVILLLTIAYENGGQVVSYFLSQNQAVPELGRSRKVVIKPDLIKDLIDKLKAVEPSFPQYRQTTGELKMRLNNALTLARTPDKKDEATNAAGEIAKKLWKFATNPMMPENKELEELEKSLALLQRRFKIVFSDEFAIVPFSLLKAESSQTTRIKRSLFVYENF
jgi:hypothetical protein